MKKFLLIYLCCLTSFACNNDNDVLATTSQPTMPFTGIFDLQKLPEIELQFSLAQWNKLLANYDLNPKNEKKVISKFAFKVDGQTTVTDSIGLKLRGNTSRRRPEGAAGELHNAANPRLATLPFCCRFWAISCWPTFPRNGKTQSEMV